VALRLEEAGLARHAEELRGARAEFLVIEQPPGLVSRMHRAMVRTAHTQWSNLVGELTESRRVWALIQRRVQTGEPLTPAEAEDVRAQLLDLVRVVPAGVIAAATAAVPVPGAALASPWVLHQLGLMPSRWREAHALDRMRRESRELRELGRDQEAIAVAEIIEELEQEADQREEAEMAAVLTSYWDADQDGRLDVGERAAYDTEVARLSGEATRAPQRKRWFLQLEGQVFGPLRWTEVPHPVPSTPFLVCLDGNSGWVALRDLPPPTA